MSARLESLQTAAELSIQPADNYEQLEPSTAALFCAHQKSFAPVDELTGMPLSVLPPSGRLPRNNPEIANWHHHYHPSNDSLLTSISGLAIRNLRVQLLPVKTHNAYHKYFERPEKLPRTSEQRFGQIILGVAGYIPAEAIDVRKDDPSEPVILSPKMRTRLQNEGEIQVRGHGSISTFVKNHLVRQDFSHVKDSIIDEFLHSPDVDRRLFLGHWLLAIASEIAVEPVASVYRQALDDGLITNKAKLPNIVKSQVNGRKTSRKAIQSLRRRLANQRP